MLRKSISVQYGTHFNSQSRSASGDVDRRRNGVLCLWERVPGICGISKLTVHLAPSSQCSSGSVSARCQDHRGKTKIRANQHGPRSAAGVRGHPSAQQVGRTLARKTRQQRTDLAEFGICRYPTRFMNASGEIFILEAVSFARQGRPQVVISDLCFRFCRPDDRTRECTRPAREKLSRQPRLKVRR